MQTRRYPTHTPEGLPFRTPEPTPRFADGPRVPTQSRASLAQMQGRVCPELHEALQRKAGHAHREA